MKKILLVLLSIMLVSGIAITGCAGPSPAPEAPVTPAAPVAPGEVIEMSLTIHLPAMHLSVKDVLQPWVEEVDKRTGGRVKITIFPGQTLATSREAYEMVKAGNVDIADVGFPLISHIDDFYVIPFNWPDECANDNALQVRDALFDKYVVPVDYANVQVLLVSNFAPGLLYMVTKPIKTLEDLKGMVIGAPSYQDKLEAWGATQEAIRTPDTYMALERGMVDGLAYGGDLLLAMKLYEVVKYATNPQGGYEGIRPIVMNIDKWNSLPPDIQKIFHELKPWAEKLAGEAMDTKAKAVFVKCDEIGIPLTVLEPAERQRWIKASEVCEEMYLAKLEAEGLVEQGRALINDFEKMREETGGW